MAASPYPVSPQVHVEDRTKDALDARTFRPAVSNGYAYARQAADILAQPADERRVVTAPETPLEVFEALAAGQGNLTDEALLMAYASEADAASVDAFVGKLALPPEMGVSYPPPHDLARRLAHLAAQRRACGEGAANVARCCRALALPFATLPAWDGLGEAEREGLRKAARAGRLRDELRERAFSGESEGLAPASDGYRLQGLKVWFAGCSQRLERIPTQLEGFKGKVGDYHAGWETEFHPAGRAKNMGRRIFRSADRKVRVAETLDERCLPVETEVVWERAAGRTSFASYNHEGARVDHGYFPGGHAKAAIKFTPDSCMGCHYTFDARRFGVPSPSWRALHLEGGPGFGPTGVDGEHCIRPGELVVRHGR
jgi:hypothetical protein